jgi:tetratricopeptide (TPR) repeat protein
MSIFPGTNPKTFNVLSIGHRGVGKTIFLAGSYAALQSVRSSSRSSDIWFDCRDKQAQDNLDKLLSYVSRTGQYPPPTMKITNFNFSVKRRGLGGERTLCHFRWWDIPGEICNFQNPDFQRILLTSHGCCVFINAKSLVYDKTYASTLEQILKQVEAIGSLVNQSNLKYIFALVLTQCDLLEPGPLGILQIEEQLRPLTSRLDAANVPYRQFYSGIPIFTSSSGAVLGGKDNNIAAPLLWMLTELPRLHSFQSQLDLASGLKRLQSKVGGFSAKNTSPFNTALTDRKNLLVLGLAGLSFLGMLLAVFYSFGLLPLGSSSRLSLSEQLIQEYQSVLNRDPSNAEALINLADLYGEQAQYDKAIPLAQKLVQQQPKNADFRLKLADLYQAAGQKEQEKAVYDQILTQDANNIIALTRKAVLLSEQGDAKTAKDLFDRAERVAPPDFKGRVREIAAGAMKTTGGSGSP